jgi:Lrp/AsnC family transcriptional regulator for asnA, asnC and gidA
MTSNRRGGERTGTDRAVAIDDVDKAIIEQLQQDGRLPYTKLGTAVGLSEAAVRQRVQRLVESGVVQIVAVTDPLTLGFRREAMIGLKIEGDLRGVADTIAAIPEVSYVVVVSGSFDLLMEVVCEDDDHLLALLNDKVRSILECAAPRPSPISVCTSRPTHGVPDSDHEPQPEANLRGRAARRPGDAASLDALQPALGLRRQ